MATLMKMYYDILTNFRNEIVDEFIRMCGGNDYNRLNLLAIAETIDRIYNKHADNLPTTAEWIDVNERLPEKEGKYIVYTESITGYKPLEYNVFIADYVFDDFVFKGWENNRVTHWQPLPEPPKNKKG